MSKAAQDLQGYGIRDDSHAGASDHWLCQLLGHNFGPWHDCARSVADRRIDHQLRGCTRCTTIQDFSPTGQV